MVERVYWGEQVMDSHVWNRREYFSDQHLFAHTRNWVVTMLDMQTDRVCVAPRWIAWFYWILPRHVHVDREGNWKREPSYFLANVAGAKWRIGLLMRIGRGYRIVPALAVDIFGLESLMVRWGWRVGVLRGFHGYVPWGIRLWKWLSRRRK